MGEKFSNHVFDKELNIELMNKQPNSKMSSELNRHVSKDLLMDNKHMQKFSNLWVTTQMQIKTTRYITFIMMATIKKRKEICHFPLFWLTPLPSSTPCSNVMFSMSPTLIIPLKIAFLHYQVILSNYFFHSTQRLPIYYIIYLLSCLFFNIFQRRKEREREIETKW